MVQECGSEGVRVVRTADRNRSARKLEQGGSMG